MMDDIQQNMEGGPHGIPEQGNVAENGITAGTPEAEMPEMETARAAVVDEEPIEEIDPLPRVEIDGVWYRRCEHDKFTMEQFDRAAAVITALGPVLGIAFAVQKDSAGNDVAGFVSYGGHIIPNVNYIDWAALSAAIEKALLQDHRALLDIAAIVYVAEGEKFNCDYLFDEHRARISGGPADMFMEGAAVFFAFYRRSISGAGRIFSALKGRRMR